MVDFHKRALIALLWLVSVSIAAGYACMKRSYLHLPLLGGQESALPWHAEAGSDALQGGRSSASIRKAKGRLQLEFSIAKSVQHPFASASLVFEDSSGKPALVDLSRFSSISFDARCSPANTLQLGIPTFDPAVTKPGNLLSYRSPSTYFSCDEHGERTEIDLTRLETAQWWFDMFKLDIARQAYKLDQVPRISFSSTFQSPANTHSTFELEDIALNGRDLRYVYGLGIFLVLAWGGFGLWFFRQHNRALIADVKGKLQRDLPLVAYQQLSLEPHKDREKAAILHYIATSYTKPELDLDTLVAETGVNRSKINEILKGAFGFTFSGYLNKLRLTEAARLLAEQASASVGEIAYSVGYGNVSYFNKLFKEEYGCTPKEFRTLSSK
jgi:AraC-like DNA-binding protein